MSVKIYFAESQKDYEHARLLFLEYADSLGFSLCFQGFDEELKNLPGKYSEPEGCILLAWEHSSCEMKRLYVKLAYRGIGLGRLLAEKILRFAKEKNYSKIMLDTLSSMESAQALYRSLGFFETEPYYNNPHPEVVFFEKTLDKASQS